MAQWWERLPPTNVAWVQFQDLASYVGWVCCWFSSLLRGLLLWVLWFSSLHKNQHFKNPIRSEQWRKSHSVAVQLQIPIYYFLLIVYFLLTGSDKQRQSGEETEEVWPADKRVEAEVWWITGRGRQCTERGSQLLHWGQSQIRFDLWSLFPTCRPAYQSKPCWDNSNGVFLSCSRCSSWKAWMMKWANRWSFWEEKRRAWKVCVWFPL